MHTIIKSFKDLTLDELYEIMKLRIEVFIIEQGCNYQDLDGTDHLAEHVMVMENGTLIAYARLFSSGIKYKEAAIGRVITKKISRGTNLGIHLMKESMKFLSEHGEKEIRLSAQVYAEGFYEKLGFQRTSKAPYQEDNIPHVEMIYKEV